MTQVSVQLPADLSQFVGELLAEGRYESESQVLTEGLRLLRSREELRRDVELGFTQLDRGEKIPGDEVFEELERRIRMKQPVNE